MVRISEDRRRGIADDVTRNSCLHRLFLQHPHAVRQTYVEHMGFAWSVGTTLLRAALAAFVHAVVPACCESYAGDTIRRVYDKLPHAHSRALNAPTRPDQL